MASTAIHGLLTVPRTAEVLGTSAYAVWLRLEDAVIVVSTRDATRLPNAVEIAADAADAVLQPVQHGAEVEIGQGRITLGDVTVVARRWWDPRPALPALTAAQLEEALAYLPSSVPGIDPEGLHEALHNLSPTQLLATAKTLLGKGSGLTPEGDDYVAGSLAALRLFGEALQLAQAERLLNRVSHPLTKLADVRTTTFSAALIRYGLRGQVAEPAGRLIRALAGRGDIGGAHTRLQDVGHSSGPALAAGIVLGARSLVEFSSHS
ncbi:MAG: DUF2877 domain-containing protein [Acidimicrobiia bacterium]|nr:DUF2877 domain-containing protein [Acidimicrobiia bacterium]